MRTRRTTGNTIGSPTAAVNTPIVRTVPRTLTFREEIAALRQFAAALNKMEPLGREAAIRWLVAKYADSTFGIFYR